jgi:hypothetical protein
MLAIALVAVVQHVLVQEVRAQTPVVPDLEAILANPRIAKSLDDIRLTTSVPLPSRSASPKFRRRRSRRKSAPNITGSGCRSSASRMRRSTAKAM